MRKTFVVAVLALVAGITAAYGWSSTVVQSSSGHGTLTNPDGSKRQFSFNAKRHDDLTVNGQAQLVNPAFTGQNTPAPYRLHIDISCMQVVGNIAIFGGTTKSTNDPSLVDAVFFAVQDNGEPGKNNDKISRVLFWDDDPTTTGDPQACLLNVPGDFFLETIDGGNIQVRPTAP